MMRGSFAWFFAIILMGLAFLSVPGATQAQSRQQVAQYEKMLVWALEQDSGSWAFNRLDVGSAGHIQKQSGYDPPHLVYRMMYTYNSGRTGWVEGYFLNGEIASIRYHDNTIWAGVRTESDRWMAEREAHDNMRRNSTSAWCRNLDIC